MPLLPGKWYVENGNICVINDDGTISVYPTSWEAERRQQAIEDALEKERQREKLKAHLSDKRIQKQKEQAKKR